MSTNTVTHSRREVAVLRAVNYLTGLGVMWLVFALGWSPVGAIIGAALWVAFIIAVA